MNVAVPPRRTSAVRCPLHLPGAALVAVLIAAAGCVTAQGPGPAAGSSPDDAPDAAASGSPSEGSLRQEEFTVELDAGGILVRLTPLDPEILRLAAPDTRRRLESLPARGDGVWFLVSVFTEQPGGVEFEPRSVSIENRGRIFRPTSIRGLTPGWGTRLEQRRAEQALYAFPAEVDLELPVVVEAAGARSDAWASILPRLDVERARVRSRGGQASRSNFRIFR